VIRHLLVEDHISKAIAELLYRTHVRRHWPLPPSPIRVFPADIEPDHAAELAREVLVYDRTVVVHILGQAWKVLEITHNKVLCYLAPDGYTWNTLCNQICGELYGSQQLSATYKKRWRQPQYFTRFLEPEPLLTFVGFRQVPKR
jgi:hypothetical protein